MRKITLLAVLMVAGIIPQIASAGTGDNRKPQKSNDYLDQNDPISFTERGIEFFVFADGQFDFNTTPSDGELFYKSGRRNVNSTYGVKPYNGEQGVKIEHDNQGRVRRIGNVFVNYDDNNRIKRVGSVYMTYNRVALTQVGGLRIVYDNRGRIIDLIGAVKAGQGNNSGHYYGPTTAYNAPGHQGSVYYKTAATPKPTIAIRK